MDTTKLWQRVKTLEAQMQLAFAKDAQIVGSFFAQGGNSFGATAVLGTNDANALQIRANSNTLITLQSGGSVNVTPVGGASTFTVVAPGGYSLSGGAVSQLLTTVGALTITGAAASTWSTGAGALTLVGAARINFQPGADSTTAFQFQNAAAGATPLAIDTTNGVSTFTSIANGQPAIRCTGGGATPSQSALIVSFTNAPAGTTFVSNFVNQANIATANGILIQAGQNTFSAASDLIRFTRPDATTIGTVQQNATTTVVYNTSSDARMKRDIADTDRGLDVVRRIRVRDFSFPGETSRHQGFVAQELAAVYPDAVTEGGQDFKHNPWQVAYGHMTPLLCKAIQDLANRLDAIEKKAA